MKTKTCRECKHFVADAEYCKEWDVYHISGDGLCKCFEPKVITNGDRIRHGGNKALVKFHLLGTCDTCIYYNKEHTSHNDICLCPKDKTCADGIAAWLNAPAESEGEDE